MSEKILGFTFYIITGGEKSDRNTGFHLVYLYYNRRLNVRHKYWVSPCIFILQQEAKCQIEILDFTLYITTGG